jgi:hypothetical protein
LIHLLKGIHVFRNFQNTTEAKNQEKVDEKNKIILKCKVIFPDLLGKTETNVSLQTKKRGNIK